MSKIKMVKIPSDSLEQIALCIEYASTHTDEQCMKSFGSTKAQILSNQVSNLRRLAAS